MQTGLFSYLTCILGSNHTGGLETKCNLTFTAFPPKWCKYTIVQYTIVAYERTILCPWNLLDFLFATVLFLHSKIMGSLQETVHIHRLTQTHIHTIRPCYLVFCLDSVGRKQWHHSNCGIFSQGKDIKPTLADYFEAGLKMLLLCLVFNWLMTMSVLMGILYVLFSNVLTSTSGSLYKVNPYFGIIHYHCLG